MANFNNPNHAFVRRFARNRLALAGLIFLAILVVLVALAPQLYPGDPFAIMDKPFLRPFDKYLLGTDALGRDIAAGIVHGGQTSLIIGVAATLAALLIGTILGALAGFYRGRTDHVLMRFTEFFQTIPSFLFAIVLVAIMSPSLKSVTIAIVVVSWPPIVRLVRAEFISLREREFIQACICLGLDDRSIALRQILPNAVSPIIVAGSLMVAAAILTEAALAFLGLGDPNIMSWGYMIGSGRSFLRDAWWLCGIPGVMILLTVLSINFVGEGLNDALNPRLRQL